MQNESLMRALYVCKSPSCCDVKLRNTHTEDTSVAPLWAGLSSLLVCRVYGPTICAILSLDAPFFLLP